jgi:hypothetical protein
MTTSTLAPLTMETDKTPDSIQESTVQYDHTHGTVELYFTSRSRFLAAIKRNGRFIRWTDLKPGYSIEYPLSECRSIQHLIKLDPSGEDAHRNLLTPEEAAARAAAGERLKATRFESAAA